MHTFVMAASAVMVRSAPACVTINAMPLPHARKEGFYKPKQDADNLERLVILLSPIIKSL